MATPEEIVTDMMRALSVSEPDLDTGVGTPIRKVLDVVGEAIATAYLDRYLLNYQYDIDTKRGPDLDAFAALFGFSRLSAKRASGVIILQRSTPAPSSIYIPVDSQVATVDNPPVVVKTSAPAVFPRGGLTASVPVQAIIGGTKGNLTSNQLIRWMTPIEGIVAVTNPASLTGGADAESDDQLRERFRRTIFRNLAGTSDMYLGIALDDPDCTSATVIGPATRWREQIQMVGGSATSTIVASTQPVLRVIGASNTTPVQISTSQFNDFIPDDVIKITNVLGNLAANGTWRVKAVQSSQLFTISKLDGSGDVVGTGAWASGGTQTAVKSDRAKWVYDTGYAFGPNIDGGTILTPGVHYSLNTTTIPPVVTSLDPVLCPDGIYDLTFNYVSVQSRNDPPLGVTNRIDVYTNGIRLRVGSETAVLDGRTVVGSYFTGPLYSYRWRRQDGSIPTLGNPIMRLSFAPVIDVPNGLGGAIGTALPVENSNFWVLNEVGTSSRAYNSFAAVEFSRTVWPSSNAITSSTNASPIVLTIPSGHNFTVGMRVIVGGHTVNSAANGVWTVSAASAISIALQGSVGNGVGGATGSVAVYHPVASGYSFDSVPRDVQVATEAWRMISTDLVVHAGSPAFLALFVAMIIKPGYALSTIQTASEGAVKTFFSRFDFGSSLQISDLLNVLGDVAGVDAVRFLNSDDITPVINVSNCNNANTLTVPSGHGINANDLVQVDNVGGYPTLTGSWTVLSTTSTTITLKVAINGTYTSGGTVIKASFATQRLEENGTTIRSGYSTATSPHRATDVTCADNEFFALAALNITVKATNTWGAV
jgi:uncharacterized phage protein gp47/JayE